MSRQSSGLAGWDRVLPGCDDCCDLQWVNNANYVIPNLYLLVVPCSWQSPIISKPLAQQPVSQLTSVDQSCILW